MAKVDVQLKSIKRVMNAHGQDVTRYPGDWVRVGKQHARRWIAEGSAWIPERGQRAQLLTAACGVVIWNGTDGSEAVLEKGMHFVHAKRPLLEYHKTMLWQPELALKTHMLPVGFSLLDRWQIAIPLCDYDTLAMHVGDDGDQARMLELVSDLRMPVYDVRLMFVRRCPDTRRLFDEWNKEPGERRLAFMRALFRAKPLVLALPTTWTEK